MKRILFVEDNDVMRQLYAAMLPRESGQWETTTAPDGETALRLVQQSPFDVVASDMQMPGMSGIELLTEVRKLHPRTTRIILSGISDQAEAANSLNCTHLFIPKPFELKTLMAALDRIYTLDAYLKDEKLCELAGKMRVLPSFPTVYLEIVKEMESPHSDTHEIAKIVAKDPGITAKILRVANSASFGLSEATSDPVEAVQQLGMSTVRSLTLSAQVYSGLNCRPLKNFSADALWGHLSRCADLATRIISCERADMADYEDAFTAGMLHDMGQLMLASSLPDEFGKALALAAQEKIPLPRAEMEIFGATHTGLAAYLFALWGLPAPIVEAVAFHHTPEKSDLKKFGPLTAIHVANALCDESDADSLNLAYLEELGLTARLDVWREAAAELHAELTTQPD
ncbi:MAG TPA: response regulator [Verrucomicrobiae bacterium]|nr:response regulator [Verrucomicrobiae bacterium]